MSWQDDYKRKLISAEEAARLVKSGDTVCIGIAQATPTELCDALGGRKDELEGIRLIHTINVAGAFGWLYPDAQKAFQVSSMFRTPIDRLFGDIVDYLPVGVSFFDKLTEDEGRKSDVDVFMVRVSAPDKHGHLSLGESLWLSKTYAKRAKLVIGEVTPGVIRCYGDNLFHISELDYLVERQTPPARKTKEDIATLMPMRVEKIEVIGANIAELVRDGDTIQLGTGDIGYAAAAYFRAKQDLGMHTEILGPEVLELVKEGVITGKRKTLHPGKVVATSFSVLTVAEEDLDYIDNNPAFELYDASYVNNPRTIAQNDNMVAINNAMAIDLTGQVAAETLGPQMWSGTGGQLDFTIGTWMARNGRVVTALPATALEDRVSRIAPALDAGNVVTIPRTLVDYVVTEYGIANLAGRTRRERARELISIAHPDFRAELTREAERL